MSDELTPQMLLTAYANGYFPMAETQDDPELYWFSPDPRGIIPLDAFNIPRGLARFLKTHPFTLKVNSDFAGTMRGCAELKATRKETWINAQILDLYIALYKMGHAHSVETWRDGKLVGGLYGVSLGGAFFGESMFSREPEASKTALVTLVDILKRAGYTLLDTQYVNPHLVQFGCKPIPKRSYMKKLEKALAIIPQPFLL